MSLRDLWHPRMRPSFLIVGAQKAGTSALFTLLASRPGVRPPTTKEIHFFDRDDLYAHGWGWYMRHFPRREKGGITFEATPNYLYVPEAPGRIARHLPHARLVMVLRDPVRRAFSAWNMYHAFEGHPRFAHLYDPRSFAQAVEEELAGRPTHRALRYLARGHYAPQVQRYADLFPREQILVLSYADLKLRQLDTLNKLTAFVGLPGFTAGEPVLATRANERPYTAPLDPALQERLRAHFAPLHAELERLLGAPIDLDEAR
ncbi:MAG: sulfotransferase [Flavobacteriales bacterium]|nr:sulfotransferase [Flavobacteriales bacterium]